jgi:uncharacterized protein (TIGR02246 family)
MYKKPRLALVALVALAALLGYGLVWNAVLSDDPKAHVGDIKAIKDAAASYSAAFEKGDVDRVLSYWSPDAEYIDETGKRMQGREAIGDHIRQSRKHLDGYKLKLEGTGLRFVTPDVVMVDGKATLVSPEGKEAVTPFVALWVKTGGKWLVRSVRDLGSADPKESASAVNPLEQLEPLVGDWASTDKGMNVQCHCRWILNKSFLQAQFTVKRGDHETTTMQQLGWDPVSQSLHSWYFDSAGGFGEATFTPTGDGWVSEAVGVLPDGRIGTAVQRLHVIDDKSVVFQSRNRVVDGRPLADIEVHFVRKAGKE